MYNMLIVEDEVIQSQFLINSIAKEIPEIRICNIASTGLDAINTIKDELADIILLDLNKVLLEKEEELVFERVE